MQSSVVVPVYIVNVYILCALSPIRCKSQRFQLTTCLQRLLLFGRICIYPLISVTVISSKTIFIPLAICSLVCCYFRKKSVFLCCHAFCKWKSDFFWFVAGEIVKLAQNSMHASNLCIKHMPAIIWTFF